MGQLKYYFLFFVFQGSILCFAQNEAIPLIKKMQQSYGIEKIDLLNEISAEYRKTDRFKSLEYARKAYSLATEKNYIPGKALAKKNEGVYWFLVGSTDSAILCYKQSLQIYTVLKDEKGMSACYNNLGLIAQETGKYNDALLLYQKSIDLDMKLGDKIGVALTMENIADVYIYRGDIRNALHQTNKCIEIYTEEHYKPGLISSFINRAGEFNYLMKYEESLRDYKLALTLARESNDKYQEIVATSNIGVIYWHMEKPAIALKYLYAALENSDEAEDAFNIDNTIKTIAQIFTFQRKFALANEMLLKILKRNDEIKNARQAAIIMTAIGRNLLELNELDKAIAYLKKSLEITVDLDTPYEKLENYKNLGHAYAVLHDFKKADSLQELFAQTYSVLSRNDSIDVEIAENTKGSLHIEQFENKSISSKSDWIVAFLLFVLVVLLSMLVYNKSSTQNHSKLE